jgi:hypothetical protein
MRAAETATFQGSGRHVDCTSEQAMNDSLAARIPTLPGTLRESIETAALLTLDATRRVAELTASVEELEYEQEHLAQVLAVAARWLRDEEERELFAFPRTPPSAQPNTQ